ncbi:conserved hypothetical protein [Ricinus communis]|uniref:RNase H type-1 domain-containing protein n=1 Tax=Ricinus communis TaxID=3988 RepID=B9S5G1_RICCO|nr:conserved hypothetical protein [Ricinus communis]
MEKFNLALLCKQAWKLIVSLFALWPQLMEALYFPLQSYWNKVVFEGKPLNPLFVIDRAQKLVNKVEHIQEQAQMVSGMRMHLDLPQSSSWSWPLTGQLKFNIDTTFSKSVDRARVGIVCRNSSGKLVDGCAKTLQALSPPMAEAYAFFEAVQLAKKLISFCSVFFNQIISSSTMCFCIDGLLLKRLTQL